MLVLKIYDLTDVCERPKCLLDLYADFLVFFSILKSFGSFSFVMKTVIQAWRISLVEITKM
jgi:hypothetical protein